MNGTIRLERDGAVAHIVIDRPDKMNAITRDMAAALAEHCAAVDRDAAIRVVVIRGEGARAFSAGSDLNALAEPDPWALRQRVEYAAVVRNVQKPVIAALRGWVLGGGLEIALGADIRIAGRGAKLGAPEVTRGWIGGGAASQMLPRLVGYGQAMRLLLGGEPIDAERALAIGLVEEVVDDDAVQARADALAATIASYSPIATQAVKAAVRAALSMPLEAGIRYENELHSLCFAAKDHLEGIRAFQARRDAGPGGRGGQG
jgi:enoyl-CoA hydratase